MRKRNKAHWRRLPMELAATALVGCVLLSGCSSRTGSTSASSAKPLKIAVLLASSQNGYNAAVLQGVQDAAKAAGGVSVAGLDGQFDSNTQFSQLQNAASQGQYNGIIVVPNDGVSLAGAFPLASQIPVVSILNPIGTDIHTMQPQVSGVVQTIAQDPAIGATKQAEAVVGHCANIDPCKVAIVSGQFNTTLDISRVDAFNAVFSKHSNIKVVATVEGKWDRAASLTAVTNVLQSNPDVNAIISQGDQMIFGAEIALQNANINESKVYLVGGGGTKSAVQKVRAGNWGMTYLSFPYTAGKTALDSLIKKLNGGTIDTWVNQDTLVAGVDAYATKQTLDATPNFMGEWDG